MSNIQMKILSSLEKCFLDEDLGSKKEKKRFVMLQNEKLSFQVAYINTELERAKRYTVSCSGSLAPYATVREVVSIPSAHPAEEQKMDEDYLRITPGLYPDLLRPLHYGGAVLVPSKRLCSLWIDISLPENFFAGDYELTLSLRYQDQKNPQEEAPLFSATAQVQVVAAALPPQRLIHTEWFYTDCLANFYGTRAFSEKHWRSIESFVRTAVQNGINMILTPVFTPELDTYIGGERLTTQLTDITVETDGTYRFGFEKLERWIDLCLRCGVEYFEIPHFFTQWGANHAPKIMAKVNGRQKRIFGWETDALGKEYAEFLGAFIPALLEVFKKRGLDKRCYFHVSDEPRMKDLEHYARCRDLIGQHLEGYPIIDALSDYAFYESGALKRPVPAMKHADPFLENKVPDLWVYYCGANGCETYTNRYFAMSLARARILGVQLYLNRIRGFLHWGYNFYNNYQSYDAIDPFGCSDGEYFAPSGDMYLVYPGSNGEAWESLRLNAMREAMDDMRALELCESLYGREYTERLILEDTDGSLTFAHYPKDGEYLIRLREKIAMLAEKKNG